MKFHFLNLKSWVCFQKNDPNQNEITTNFFSVVKIGFLGVLLGWYFKFGFSFQLFWFLVFGFLVLERMSDDEQWKARILVSKTWGEELKGLKERTSKVLFFDEQKLSEEELVLPFDGVLYVPATGIHLGSFNRGTR